MADEKAGYRDGGAGGDERPAGTMRRREHRKQRIDQAHAMRFMKASHRTVKLTASQRWQAMFVSPIPIGPFLIEESGRLTLRRPEPAPGFSFVWRGINCTVRLSAGTMVLRALAGRIPSTADGKTLRDEALAVLRALPASMPPALRLRLMPDYRIQMEAESPLAWPMTAAALISPIVNILLRMAPAIDVLGEAGLGLR